MTERRRMSNGQFNNLYVRSNRGNRREVERASEDSVKGTNDEVRDKSAKPQ